MGRLLRVDLTNRRCVTEPLDEAVARKYLGTRGLGAYYLWLLDDGQRDPLSEGNPVIFSTGPLTGTPAFGPAGYFTTISPLTGVYLDSGIRGRFPSAFKYAGFDAAIIEGKADSPVYLYLHDQTAEIRDASGLWGKTAIDTEDAIRQELETPEVKVVSIGPAGENQVRLACVVGDRYRAAGRGGLGAVFGSKNLKAIAAWGRDRIALKDPEKFLQHTLELHKIIDQNAEPLRSQGTLWLVESMEQYGLMPVHNFTKGTCDIAKISGPYAVTRKRRDAACHSCSLRCSNLIEGFYRERGAFSLEGPEYESLDLLGPNCEVLDLDPIAYINLLCDELGLDTMSLGATLSFAMELNERGIPSGIDLKWGDVPAILATVRDIAYRRGSAAVLGEGSRRAAMEIGHGAERFAMHVKGLEFAGYDPRGAYGMALAYATADRGACHLRAWTIYEEVMGKLKATETAGKAGLVWSRQHRKLAMDTLGICEQIGLIPLFGTLLADATGWSVEPVYSRHYQGMLEGFAIDGDGGVYERIYNLTRMINVRRGLDRKDDNLPDRFFEESLPGPKGSSLPPIDRRAFEAMVDEYYGLRGWDATGRPLPETMERLGLKGW